MTLQVLPTSLTQTLQLAAVLVKDQDQQVALRVTELIDKQKKLSQLIGQKEQEIAFLKQEKSLLTQKIESLTTRVSLLEKTNGQLKDEITGSNKKAEERLAATRAEMTAALEALKKAHAAEIEAVKKEAASSHATKMQAILSQVEATQNQLYETHNLLMKLHRLADKAVKDNWKEHDATQDRTIQQIHSRTNDRLADINGLAWTLVQKCPYWILRSK